MCVDVAATVVVVVGATVVVVVGATVVVVVGTTVVVVVDGGTVVVVVGARVVVVGATVVVLVLTVHDRLHDDVRAATAERGIDASTGVRIPSSVMAAALLVDAPSMPFPLPNHNALWSLDPRRRHAMHNG
jgi:hypothetical protein